MAGRKAMGKTTMHELLNEFAALGGQALEVVSGSHTPPQYAEFARYAQEFNLLSSCGSDFHGPDESYRDLGRLPDFPLECRPVWTMWEATPPGLPLCEHPLRGLPADPTSGEEKASPLPPAGAPKVGDPLSGKPDAESSQGLGRG
jgi:hypothetical protein